ncbi:MAG TPA: hypothetical protein VNK82_10185 [Terriglobales bacterium]|nr:hypothetical protein [Terriglobales bacterium]
MSTRTRVASLFQVWQDVATSNIAYSRAGFISAVSGFAGGDVDTGAELTALENACGSGQSTQSFIVYDANGRIFDDLGVDTESVIGFAGPCGINSAGRITGGEAVMNGLFTDGVTAPGAAIPNPADISNEKFNAAFIHEFGHFSGLDHSQINVNCLGTCGADDESGLPTMFPILVSLEMATLATDDIAWISRLYPQLSGGTTFAGTHGTLTGTVRFSDTMTHAQGVNVIARPVDTGTNQDRKFAVSVVSGFKFTGNPGQSVTAAPYLNGASDNTGGDSFGSRQTADIGRFEIPVPTGSYTIEVESINAGFDGGSSVGPLDPPIPMPGTAPAAAGPFAVAAGGTVNAGDIVLVGTNPRLDAFEGGKKRRAQTISE